MGQLWLLKWTGNWAENSRQEFWFRLRWRPFWEQHEAEVNKIQRKVYFKLFLASKNCYKYVVKGRKAALNALIWISLFHFLLFYVSVLLETPCYSRKYWQNRLLGNN